MMLQVLLFKCKEIYQLKPATGETFVSSLKKQTLNHKFLESKIGRALNNDF